ncbi:MAG: HNH endonuclease [Gammaproteobacteria bacterium]|nr:HNH endonuclease [Gammaproteobacteria bacterium]
MTLPLILRLDVTGQPVKWIDWQEAANIYARDCVAWTAGENSFLLHGGFSRCDGQKTLLSVNSIIAVKGENRRSHHKKAIPPLNNRELFRRDHHTCLYCGKSMKSLLLTRDHVKPLSKGGQDIWSNVVTACRRCNTNKGDRLLDSLNMKLLAVPYIPNVAEYLVLRNRKILGDQMAFLKMQFSHFGNEWNERDDTLIMQ